MGVFIGILATIAAVALPIAAGGVLLPPAPVPPCTVREARAMDSGSCLDCDHVRGCRHPARR